MRQVSRHVAFGKRELPWAAFYPQVPRLHTHMLEAGRERRTEQDRTW